MLKKITNNLAYIIIGIVLAISGGIVYAANVTVPQAIVKGDLPCGQFPVTGNYTLLHPGSDGLVLTASSTAPCGLTFQSASSTGGTGISSLNGLVASSQTFATGTVTGLSIGFVSSGSTHTLNPQLTAGFNIPLTASTTNWNNLYNDTLSRLSVGTTSVNTGFYVTTSTNAIIINFPNNLLSTTSAASTYTPLTRNINTTAPITGGGDLSADRTIACNVASIAQAGCLASADFLTFNNKLSGAGAAGQIAFYSAPTTTTGSNLFTFTTAGGLVNTATSTLASTTIANLAIGTSTLISPYKLVVDGQSYLGNTVTIPNNISFTFLAASAGNNNSFKNGTDNTFLFDIGANNNVKIKGGDSGGATALCYTDLGFNCQWSAFSNGNTTQNGSLTVSSSTVTSTFAGNLTVSGKTTLANASTTNLSVLNNLFLPAMTNGCLQVTSGLATSTGIACGSGGSGNSAFTIGAGLIYNATSTDLVGIGTTAPTTTLFVQGKGGTNPFAVASSTGVQMLTVDQMGDLGVGSSSPASRLTVQGTSGQTYPLFNVASSSNTTYFMVTSQGNVGIGTISPTTLLTVTRQSGFQQPVSGSTMQVVGLDGNPTRITIDTSNGASSSGNALMFRRSRGTGNTPTAVILDDVLGSLNFKGWGTTGWATSTALISAKAEGTSTDASMPTNLTFDTTATGTTVALERMRITGAGLIGIGTITPTATLNIQGTTSLPTTLLLNLASSSGTSVVTVAASGQQSAKIGTSTTSTSLANLYLQGSGAIPFFIIASSTGTQVVTVTAAARVGINTSTPAFGFVNIGTAQFSGLTTSGATQPATICADASGQLISDTLGGGCVVSSKRFKRDILNSDLGLDLFLKLTPVTYIYRPDWLGSKTENPNYNGRQEGVIAEDVQKYAPDLVTVEVGQSSYDGAATGTVHGLQDFSHWLGPITQSFKDLQKEIDSIQVGKVKKSAQDNWQDIALILLFGYVIYNEWQKRREKK